MFRGVTKYFDKTEADNPVRYREIVSLMKYRLASLVRFALLPSKQVPAQNPVGWHTVQLYLF